MSKTRGMLLAVLSTSLMVAMWFVVPCEDVGIATRAHHILSVYALVTLCILPFVYRLLPRPWHGALALVVLFGPTLGLWIVRPLFLWEPLILFLAVLLAVALAAAPPTVERPASLSRRLCWFLLVASVAFVVYYLLTVSLLPLDATRILARSTRHTLNTCLRQAPFLAVAASSLALDGTEIVALVPLVLFAATRAGSRLAAPGVERFLLLLFALAYLLYQSPESPTEWAVHVSSIAAQLVVLSSARPTNVASQPVVERSGA